MHVLAVLIVLAFILFYCVAREMSADLPSWDEVVTTVAVIIAGIAIVFAIGMGFDPPPHKDRHHLYDPWTPEKEDSKSRSIAKD